MGCHASIRGVMALELVPEFLWKYMDTPIENTSGLTGNQKIEKTDNQS